MCQSEMLHVTCHCGAIQWKAPMSADVQTCSCGMCWNSDVAWVTCDPNDFEITRMHARVVGHQAGLFTQRHYHCGTCRDALWTWTPDWRRNELGGRENDYENPILNWNIRLAERVSENMALLQVA